MEKALIAQAKWIEQSYQDVFNSGESLGSCKKKTFFQEPATPQIDEDGQKPHFSSVNAPINTCDSTKISKHFEEEDESTDALPQPHDKGVKGSSQCQYLPESMCGERVVECDDDTVAAPRTPNATYEGDVVPQVHRDNCNKCLCNGDTWDESQIQCQPRTMCYIDNNNDDRTMPCSPPTSNCVCVPAWDYSYCEWQDTVDHDTNSRCVPKAFRESAMIQSNDDSYARQGMRLSDHCAAYHVSTGWETAMDGKGDPIADKVVCATHQLSKPSNRFLGDDEQPTGSWAEHSRKWMFQYYGDQATGLALFQPGRNKNAERGAQYDPRLRPWYSSAASGPKDVIMIIDESGSMSNGQRMDNAKKAAKAIIKTLTWADKASIIKFNSEATAMDSKLITADVRHRKRMEAFVDDISANGKTNYEAAFTTAFKQMEETKRDGETTGCSSVILFLTDGEITVGARGQALHDIIAQKNHDDLGVRIFTYALGDDVGGATEVKEIACRNQGLYHAISDDKADSLNGVMANYYKYFALGIVGDGTKHTVRYSEMYGDSSTAEWMFTGAVPVYDRTTDPPGFFGVVAADVLAEPMKDENDFLYETCRKNREASAVCADLELKEETIERLRAETDRAGFGGDLGASCDGFDVGLFLGLGIPSLVVCCGALLCCMSRSGKKGGGANGRPQAPVVIIQQQPQTAPQQVVLQQQPGVPAPGQAPAPSFQAPSY